MIIERNVRAKGTRAGRGVLTRLIAAIAALLFWAAPISARHNSATGLRPRVLQSPRSAASLAEQLPNTASQAVKQRVEDFDLFVRTLSNRDYDEYLDLFTDYSSRVAAIKNYYPRTMWPKVTEEERAGRINSLYRRVYCYSNTNSSDYYVHREEAMASYPWVFYFLVPGAHVNLSEVRTGSTGNATIFLELQFTDEKQAPLVVPPGYCGQALTGAIERCPGRHLEDVTIRLDTPGQYVSETDWRHTIRDGMFESESMGGPLTALDVTYYSSSGSIRR